MIFYITEYLWFTFRKPSYYAVNCTLYATTNIVFIKIIPVQFCLFFCGTFVCCFFAITPVTKEILKWHSILTVFVDSNRPFFPIILHWIIAVPTAAGRKPMSLFLWGARTESLFFPSSHQGVVQGSSLSTLQAGTLQGVLLSAWFLGCSLGFGDRF